MEKIFLEILFDIVQDKLILRSVFNFKGLFI